MCAHLAAFAACSRGAPRPCKRLIPGAPLLRLSLNKRMLLGTATAPRRVRDGTAPAQPSRPSTLRMQPTTIGDDFDDAPASPKPRAHRRTREPVRTSELVDDGTIPATEPKAKAAEPAPAAAPAALATVRIAAEQMVPDVQAEPVEDEGSWYWVGLLPGAPRSCVHVAGIAFQRNCEIPFRGKVNPLDQERELCDGELVAFYQAYAQQGKLELRITDVQYKSLLAAAQHRQSHLIHHF